MNNLLLPARKEMTAPAIALGRLRGGTGERPLEQSLKTHLAYPLGTSVRPIPAPFFEPIKNGQITRYKKPDRSRLRHTTWGLDLER